MDYRLLGKTGLKVSVLSLGASSLGGVFRDIDETEGIRTVHTALDLGINLIDVSPFYGLTRAETILGQALKSVPRDRYYLATKVGRYGDEEFDFSAKRVTASVDESLTRLGLDYIDIIQCHDIEYGSLDQIVSETLPALRQLQAQGKTCFVGITGLPLKIFRYVMERAELDTILTYCHYTLQDTSLADLIPALQAKQIGIINASPLASGLLTNRGAPPWHSATADIKEVCVQAAAYCRSKGADISKLAVQFTLANPDIPTTLVSTANPDNIRRNVAWLEEPLDQELLQGVREVLKPVQNKLWVTGRAENN